MAGKKPDRPTAVLNQIGQRRRLAVILPEDKGRSPKPLIVHPLAQLHHTQWDLRIFLAKDPSPSLSSTDDINLKDFKVYPFETAIELSENLVAFRPHLIFLEGTEESLDKATISRIKKVRTPILLFDDNGSQEPSHHSEKRSPLESTSASSQAVELENGVHKAPLLSTQYGDWDAYLKEFLEEQKPRVLHIITTMDVGGAEKSCIKTVSREHGTHHIIVLKGKHELAEELDKRSLDVTYLNMNSFIGVISSFPLFLKALRSFNPDRIVGWMYHGSFFGLIAKLLGYSSPQIWMIRNKSLAPEYSGKLTRILTTILGKASKSAHIFFNSFAARDSHPELASKTDSSVRQNSFDVKRFIPREISWSNLARQEIGLDSSRPIIGWVSRHHPQKGPKLFLEFASKTKEAIPNVQFLTIGKGLSSNSEIWKNSLVKHGLIENTFGFENVSDIENWYPLMDILVLTSVDESFPNVLGEAQACGINCISFDVGDAESLLYSPLFLIPNGDTSAMSEKVTDLLKLSREELLEKGLLARDHISKNFADTPGKSFTF